MKKVFIIFCAIVGFTVSQLSAETLPLAKNTTEVASDELKLKLELGNISGLDKSEVSARINEFLVKNLPKNSELECSVTVTASVNVGVAEAEISVTVSGPCSEVRKEGTKIAKQVIAEIKAALS